MSNASGKITLWGVEVFVATAEEASLTAAARRLRASAATVSQQLTNLEGAIGAILLNRQERPVTLTPAGEVFLGRANAILAEAAAARAELALAHPEGLTRLRLGMIEDFDAEVTPRLLSGLARDLPRCRFQLETGASHRLYEGLDTRALDMVVAAEMGPAGEGMEYHPLLEEPFVAAAPLDLDLGQDPAAALAGLPLIQYTTRHYIGRLIADHLSGQGFAPSQRFELDSYHAILAMVAAGAGWSILTPLGWLAGARFRAQVRILPLPLPPLSRRIGLTARRRLYGDLPADIAGRLRRLTAEQVVAPTLAELPWLRDRLRLL